MRTLLIAVAAVVGMAGCSTQSSSPPTPDTSVPAAGSSATAATSSATAAAPAPDPGACHALDGTVDAAQVCRVHTANDTYTIDMGFPVTYPDQQAVQDVLIERRDGFVEFVSEQPTPDHPYALDAQSKTYRSGSPTSGTESLVFTVYSSSGAAHPTTSFDAFNYDLGKGAPVTLESLFRPGTDPAAVLDPIVSRELSQRWGSAVEANTLGARTYEDFALTDDEVIFFFSQGLWLPQVAGPQEVSVPRAELDSALA